MNVNMNDWIAVEYSGKFEDGKVFDSNIGKDPLKLKVGAKMVVPGFENAIISMDEGEEKEVVITPEQGYGPKNEEPVELSKASFQDTSVLEVGKELQMMTNMGPLLVNVLEVNDDKIKVLLNHPLAGKTLHFKIKVVKILDEEEAKVEDKKLEDGIKQMQEQMAKAQEAQANSDVCGCGADHSEECSDDKCDNKSCDCETKE